MKAHVPNVCMLPRRFGTSATQELHEELPVETAEESAIEMLLLARSEILVRFPPSGSWFSYLGSLYARKVIM